MIDIYEDRKVDSFGRDSSTNQAEESLKNDTLSEAHDKTTPGLLSDRYRVQRYANTSDRQGEIEQALKQQKSSTDGVEIVDVVLGNDQDGNGTFVQQRPLQTSPKH